MQSGQIEIFDAIGNRVVNQILDASTNSLQINTSNLPNGIYTSKITINNEVISINKIVILH